MGPKKQDRKQQKKQTKSVSNKQNISESEVVQLKKSKQGTLTRMQLQREREERQLIRLQIKQRIKQVTDYLEFIYDQVVTTSLMIKKGCRGLIPYANQMGDLKQKLQKEMVELGQKLSYFLLAQKNPRALDGGAIMIQQEIQRRKNKIQDQARIQGKKSLGD